VSLCPFPTLGAGSSLLTLDAGFGLAPPGPCFGFPPLVGLLLRCDPLDCQRHRVPLVANVLRGLSGHLWRRGNQRSERRAWRMSAGQQRGASCSEADDHRHRDADDRQQREGGDDRTDERSPSVAYRGWLSPQAVADPDAP
jgi:hypothetical protein